MRTFLIIIPDGGMLFEATGIADILMQANRLRPADAPHPLYQVNEDPIRELQTWLPNNLTSDLSVENLAERAAMSPRNFTRVFTRETGVTPTKYVEEVRLNAARQHLEQTTHSIEKIAVITGFGRGINLRRVFERSLQLTPTEYRQRFHARKMA